MVATAHGPAGMLMYDDDHGTRIAMLVRAMKSDTDDRMVEHTNGDVAGFTWASKGLGYSMVGPHVRDDTPPACRYILNYRAGDGRSRRYTIGKHGSPWTCEEARGKAVSLLRDLSAGIDPLEVKTKGKEILTLAELVELYLSEGPAEKPNKKASSWEADRSNLVRHILPPMGADHFLR